MTEIQQHTMSVRDAEKLTERIRYMAMSVRDGVQKLQELVSQAQDGQAHLALGYKSWTAYIADVMGEEPLQLRSREERREVVSWLAGQGMSGRAIAPIIKASPRTVDRDIAAASNDAPASPATPDEPTFDPTPSWDPVDTNTGEILTEDTPKPRSVTGMDGKTYTLPEPREAPEPTKPRRRPITDQFFDAAYDFRKNVERLDKLTADDRFPKNKEQIALSHKNDLLRLAETLQRVLRELD